MLYLTPERFRTMGVGSDLSGIEEWELRSMLESASRMVDAYCAVPARPSPFSFRGGTITNEPHEWLPGTVRFFFDYRPVKTLTSFQAFASNTVFLTVAPDQIYINEHSGWGEIVATQYSLAGSAFPMMPFWGLGVPVVRINYTYGWSLPVVGEFLEPTDAMLYRGLNQFWDPLEDVNVYVNGAVLDPDDDLYTVDFEEGTLLFNPGLDLEDLVTVDYTHTMPFEIARATALIASTSLSERDLTAKGMGQLAEISVEEVRLRRDARRTGTVVASEAIPNAAQALLAGFRYITVR